MTDLISLVMRKAAREYGGNDGMFNSACFSNALCSIAGVRGPLDGLVVEVILWARKDVEPLGGAHWRIRGKAQ